MRTHTHIYIYIHACELNNLGCTNHTPTAGCLGKSQTSPSPLRMAQGTEVQKRGRCCCGQPGIEKCNKFILDPGGHGEEPCKGISFFGVGPLIQEIGWYRFPYPCGLLPGEPHMHTYIYIYTCMLYSKVVEFNEFHMWKIYNQ